MEKSMSTAFNRKESYSSLSLLKQCPYRYYLRYIEKKYAETKSIALVIGTLCHKVMELKYLGEAINYTEILKNGYTKDTETIKGLADIQDEYFDEWMKQGRKSGLSYLEKLKTFADTIEQPIDDSDWETVGCEVPFEIAYKDVTIIGQIDRIDINKQGEYRVIDYKTSDTVYSDKDLKTPLQMFIYALAVKNIYGKYPAEFVYDFILLGEQRLALTGKDWKSRGFKALDRILDVRSKLYEAEIFTPKTTPLCYWCDYCRNGENKDAKTKNLCSYFSLWTPNNKTFEVNEKYNIEQGGFSPKKDDFVW